MDSLLCLKWTYRPVPLKIKQELNGISVFRYQLCPCLWSLTHEKFLFMALITVHEHLSFSHLTLENGNAISNREDCAGRSFSCRHPPLYVSKLRIIFPIEMDAEFEWNSAKLPLLFCYASNWDKSGNCQVQLIHRVLGIRLEIVFSLTLVCCAAPNHEEGSRHGSTQVLQ